MQKWRFCYGWFKSWSVGDRIWITQRVIIQNNLRRSAWWITLEKTRKDKASNDGWNNGLFSTTIVRVKVQFKER